MNWKQDFVVEDGAAVVENFDFDFAVSFAVGRKKISGGRWRLHLVGGVEKGLSTEAVAFARKMN